MNQLAYGTVVLYSGSTSRNNTKRRDELRMLYTGLALSAVLGSLGQAAALEPRLNNGLGRTPALGWNSWVSHAGAVPIVDD